MKTNMFLYSVKKSEILNFLFLAGEICAIIKPESIYKCSD